MVGSGKCNFTDRDIHPFQAQREHSSHNALAHTSTILKPRPFLLLCAYSTRVLTMIMNVPQPDARNNLQSSIHGQIRVVPHTLVKALVILTVYVVEGERS